MTLEKHLNLLTITLADKTLIDYKGYEINKDEVPTWIVFPWEEWEK